MVSKGVLLQRCLGRKRKHKKEDNHNRVQKRARVKAMQGQNDSSQKGSSNESMDFFSQLPDHVLHHTLSLLRNVKDAVRTSVLSKRWRTLWYSFSTLMFDDRRFVTGIEHEDSSNKEKMFRDYVSNSLQIHLEKNVGIQKLVVHMTSFDSEAAPDMDHWLSVARAENIKELDLHVGIKKGRRYTLPQTVFSTTTMTGLRLSGCKLQTSNNIMLPHLRKLYLRKLHLAEHIIHNLISSCLSIDDLRFIQCSGLKYLQVSNLLQLNRVEIHHCNQLKKVELIAPNLHTFWLCGKKSTFCKVSLVGCDSLKRLTLQHPQVTRDFSENRFSDFPLLEMLDLNLSDKMRHISILNPKLQRLSLKGCNKLASLLIDAPKLVSFEYKGETVPFIDIHPLRLTDAKLSFEPKRKDSFVFEDPFWFFMREFIKKFDPQGLNLVVHSYKHIVIYENLKNITIPPLPDLGFEIIKSSCVEESLLILLPTLRPLTLSIISPSDSKFPMLFYKMIKNKDKDPVCCRYSTLNNKCWRHFLEDIKFEDVKDMKTGKPRAVEDKRTYAWYSWLEISSITLGCQNQITNMRLYWNSHQHGVET